MERKFAELRKKKEERKRKEEEAAAASAAPKSVAGEGGTAMEKAKAALARRAAAEQAKKSEPVQRSTTPATPKPASTAEAPADPVQAAKRALEARNRKQEGSALRRPTIKRVAKPMAAASPKQDQDTASPSHPNPSSRHSLNQVNKRAHQDEWGGDRGQGQEMKRPRTRNNGNQHEEFSRNDATLFVGDLPPYFKNDDLERFFTQFGELEQVRLMGGQCYAFVTFERAEVVQQIVEKYRNKPLTIAGHELRVNMAHGHLPEWKRAPIPGGGEHTAAPPVRGQHPKVLAAQQQGDMLAQQYMRAGAHGLDLTARPPPFRELVSYDDL